MTNNLNAFYNRYSGPYVGEQLSNEQFSFNLHINNRFTLLAGFTAELSGMYNSPRALGIARTRSQYALNVGAAQLPG